jgi:hypothetical protein
MVHHHGDISLSILAHISSFRDEIADELMVSFSGAFLEGGLRITEEDPGSAQTVRCEFNMCRIGKLTSIVSKAELENAGEPFMSQGLIQRLKHILHRFGVITVSEKSKHHLAVDEMDGQKDLAAFLANNGVQLDNGGIRILIHKAPETSVISANPASSVHLEC